MDILRTPEERFAGLEDWPYEPRYTEIDDGLRMHYVDEGSGPTVMLTHGEPTWAYLYRKMIPGLVDAGYRVVAPDLVGFGRSDKPSEHEDFTYANHIAWFTSFVDVLDPGPIVLFCQDWGGLIGLVHAAHHPDRYAGVVASNTGVPPGIDVALPDDSPFARWKRMAAEMDPFVPSVVVGGDSPLNQVGHRLTPGEAAAYDAPFPDESYCAGPRRFPQLVVLSADDPGAPLCREAWELLGTFDRPLLTAFGDRDDVTGVLERILQNGVPGAKGRDHVSVTDAGHFVQEHAPAVLVDTIVAFAREIG